MRARGRPRTETHWRLSYANVASTLALVIALGAARRGPRTTT